MNWDCFSRSTPTRILRPGFIVTRRETTNWIESPAWTVDAEGLPFVASQSTTIPREHVQVLMIISARFQRMD